MAKKSATSPLTMEQRRTSICEALRYAEQARESVVELIADRRLGLAQKPGMGVDAERRVRDAFATAAVRMLRFLQRLEDDGDVKAGELRRDFELAVPGVRDFRNMLEHADEYMVGQGNKQSDFMKELPPSPNRRGIASLRAEPTTSATFVRADGSSEMWLGAHIELNTANKALDRMHRRLVTLREKRSR